MSEILNMMYKTKKPTEALLLCSVCECNMLRKTGVSCYDEDKHKSVIKCFKCYNKTAAKIYTENHYGEMVVIDNIIEIPKETWGYACNYCKHSKLSADEIDEMEKEYIFSSEPCNECVRNYKISQLI